ncbi:MAG TPA: MlaD family protein [Xanthomonadaceae bacterium]|nr:MlaD family protein [Xanthomonadaceae bacterium]
METKANYVLIGAFTLGVVAFALLFALWAARWSSQQAWDFYDIVFREAVTGLSEGGTVQYNGIAVGTVEDLSLMPNDPRKVVARIRVEADTPVRVDTRAKLSITGLTGTTFIQLTGGSPGAEPLRETPGHDVPVIPTEPSALQNIAQTADRIVARVDEILSEENVAHVSATLENLEAVSGALAMQRQDLSELVVSARRSSQELEATLRATRGAVEGIDRELVDELPALVAKLDSALVQLELASTNANALIAENRAPISEFTQGGLQQVGPTLVELRTLIRDLRRVTNRFDGNPAGYMLGREQPKEFEPQ